MSAITLSRKASIAAGGTRDLKGSRNQSKHAKSDMFHSIDNTAAGGERFTASGKKDNKFSTLRTPVSNKKFSQTIDAYQPSRSQNITNSNNSKNPKQATAKKVLRSELERVKRDYENTSVERD